MKLVGVAEKLIPKSIGEERLVYATFLIPGGLEEANKLPSKLPKGNAIICSLKEELKREKVLLEKAHEDDSVVTLEFAIRVIKLEKRRHRIKSGLPDLKNMPIKQREIVEQFYEEAYQLEKQMKGMERPLAPTVYLEEMHTKIIGFGDKGCRAVEGTEKIFSFKD